MGTTLAWTIINWKDFRVYSCKIHTHNHWRGYPENPTGLYDEENAFEAADKMRNIDFKKSEWWWLWVDFARMVLFVIT